VIVRPDATKVLFLLTTSGGGGGAHSVVQEAHGMRLLGIDAKVAILEKHFPLYQAQYRTLDGLGDLFLRLVDVDDLRRGAPAFDVAIATIFTSVPLLKEAAAANPDLLPAYYIQDYEPFFFEPGSPQWLEAEATYTAIPGMLLFAKTDWLRDIVELRHGVPVHKVSPSLDHDVYHSADNAFGPRDRVVLSAMIRPRTPRRSAAATMELLREVAVRHGNAVDVHIFGCDDAEITERGLTRDFLFTNHGKLTREGVAGLLRRTDCFVDLSVYQAFGRTGLEAMACGATAILPAAGGAAEYAAHGLNALVVDTFDLGAGLAATNALVEDERLRSAVRKAALATAEAFSIDRAVRTECAAIAQRIGNSRTAFIGGRAAHL